jgi:hypothetical protein
MEIYRLKEEIAEITSRFQIQLKSVEKEFDHFKEGAE